MRCFLLRIHVLFWECVLMIFSYFKYEIINWFRNRIHNAYQSVPTQSGLTDDARLGRFPNKGSSFLSSA